MTTGIGVFFSIFWVCALNALQNSMMLTPCWPSAGPIGGDGFAEPAGTCNLIKHCTFFATFKSPGFQRPAYACLPKKKKHKPKQPKRNPAPPASNAQGSV